MSMTLHGVTLAIVIVLDQVTKYLIVTNNLPYLLNTGVAFSIPIPSLAIFILNAIILIWLYTLWPTCAEASVGGPKCKVFPIALGLIVGGTIGNLIDRIRLGAVIDFIQLPYWPSFNVADSAICIGMVLLLWQLMEKQKVESKKQNQLK